jgi:hypothetical protein
MVGEDTTAPAPVPVDPAPVKKETDKMRSARRADELQGLTDAHLEAVDKAHEDYPTPPIKFQDMTLDEQTRWNLKRGVIDKLNRDYHYAVRDAVKRHQDEEVV